MDLTLQISTSANLYHVIQTLHAAISTVPIFAHAMFTSWDLVGNANVSRLSLLRFRNWQDTVVYNVVFKMAISNHSKRSPTLTLSGKLPYRCAYSSCFNLKHGRVCDTTESVNDIQCYYEPVCNCSKLLHIVRLITGTLCLQRCWSLQVSNAL